MWIKCAGCRFFAGLMPDGTTKCTRVPTPEGVSPLIGCYWGEPETRRKRAQDGGPAGQGKLFR